MSVTSEDRETVWCYMMVMYTAITVATGT